MQKSTLITLGIGVVIVGGILYYAVQSRTNLDQTSTLSTNQGEQSMDNQANQSSNEVVVKEDEVVGQGAEVKVGDTVSVAYTGTFTNGTQFDSSAGRGPFEFKVGAGAVIEGWDEGLVGMKVGGKRKLTVPPSKGYGYEDYSSIPGGSTLIFEIDLLAIK